MNWRHPTGEGASLESPGSFVHDHGFGLEEWLFEFSWQQPGPQGTSGLFKYGYLTPIYKHYDLYQGRTFAVLVYTIDPQGKADAVAVINNLFVPSPQELAIALDYMRSKNWLREMESHLLRLQIPSSELRGNPDAFINVRYRQADVIFFDRPHQLPADSVVNRNKRYQAFDWDGQVPIATKSLVPNHPIPTINGTPRSEKARRRAAIAALTYDPAHSKLQNALYRYLKKTNPRSSVSYESSRVDITMKVGRTVLFYEIKTALTVKSCIREALGQLLEYSMYPSACKANKLIVVADCEPSVDDIAYLQHLRTQFSFPLHYQQWRWADGALGNEF